MNANWMLKAPDESGRLAWASDSSPRSHAERGNERVTLSCWGREQLMEAAAFEDQPSEASLTCAHCGNTEREERFELPLCAQCRDLLCRRPFPVWIKISCTIILAVCVFAGVRSVNSFRAGIAFERGRQAEQRGRFAEAADHYEQVKLPSASPTPLLHWASWRLLACAPDRWRKPSLSSIGWRDI